jgi:hypothetical protein
MTPHPPPRIEAITFTASPGLADMSVEADAIAAAYAKAHWEKTLGYMVTAPKLTGGLKRAYDKWKSGQQPSSS